MGVAPARCRQEPPKSRQGGPLEEPPKSRPRGFEKFPRAAQPQGGSNHALPEGRLAAQPKGNAKP